MDGVAVERVPLTLTLGERHYLDDDSLDVLAYLDASEKSPDCPKTAAPSSQRFLEAYDDDDQVFAVTLSSKLSGTFESASLAARRYLEEGKSGLVHVFDSLSASVGEALVAMKIAELSRLQLPRQRMIEGIEHFISDMRTYFILDRFDTIVKNGRMNPTVAKLASILHIKPICAGVDGNMAVVDKARGYKKAVSKLIKLMKSQAIAYEQRILAIAHCDCLEKSTELQADIMRELPFKDSFLVETGGLCSTYASRGGIIIAY